MSTSTQTPNIFDQIAQETAQQVEKAPPAQTPTPATPAPTAGASENIFDQIAQESAAQNQPATPADPMDADKSIGPEERQFLKNNPTYKYLPKDPRFPNREPGIYPTGPGNEWRNDPNHPNHDISQAPVDLHLLKHTAQGAAEGAIPVALATGLPAAAPVLEEGAGLASEYAEHFGRQGVELITKMAKAHPAATKAIVKTLIGTAGGAGFGHSSTGALIGLLSSLI